MCGPPVCTVGPRLQIESAREYGLRPWLEDSLSLLALHSWEKIKLWCGGHPAVLLFWWQLWGSCAGRCSFRETGIDVYLNPVHWSWDENILGHPKSCLTVLNFQGHWTVSDSMGFGRYPFSGILFNLFIPQFFHHSGGKWQAAFTCLPSHT